MCSDGEEGVGASDGRNEPATYKSTAVPHNCDCPWLFSFFPLIPHIYILHTCAVYYSLLSLPTSYPSLPFIYIYIIHTLFSSFRSTTTTYIILQLRYKKNIYICIYLYIKASTSLYSRPAIRAFSLHVTLLHNIRDFICESV